MRISPTQKEILYILSKAKKLTRDQIKDAMTDHQFNLRSLNHSVVTKLVNTDGSKYWTTKLGREELK